MNLDWFIDVLKSNCKEQFVDNCGNTNMDYNVDDTESVLNFGRVIICDYVEACLCFGNMFASVFSSKVS